MGVYGPGLYSGDLAMDLRSTIRAVARLPFDGEKILNILCDTERAAAEDAQDGEHTTFWLVVAEQFAKRGIPCDAVRSKALRIIESAEDLANLTKLGMDPTYLKKRKKILEGLRARLVTPP